MKVNSHLLSQFSNITCGFFPQRTAIPEIEGLGLVTLNQVHGASVVVATSPGEGIAEADGLVTTVPHLALGILTADCGPVLLYDPKARVIGACHAGWKGAKAGIVQETLSVMVDLGAKRENTYAALGPTIQQQNYEVGPEFPDLIGCYYEPYFRPSPTSGHYYFNLPLYIMHILANEGLLFTEDVEVNTFPGPFLSRRRALHQGKEPISDNLSVIAMR